MFPPDAWPGMGRGEGGWVAHLGPVKKKRGHFPKKRSELDTLSTPAPVSALMQRLSAPGQGEARANPSSAAAPVAPSPSRQCVRHSVSTRRFRDSMSSGREGLPSALLSREKPTADALHVHCPRGHDGGGGPGSASPRRPSSCRWTQRDSQAPEP